MEQERESAGGSALGSITVLVNGTEQVFAPSDAPVVLGRESTCDVVFDNQNVSRRHAELRHVAGGWRLHDLDSRQGTFLDGERVDEAGLAGRQDVTLGVDGIGESFSVRAQGSVTIDPLPAPPSPPPAPAPSAPPAPPAAPAERPAPPAAEGTIITSGPRLQVQCAGRSYDFGSSAVVILGRGTEADVVSPNPSVSRRHARLFHGPNGWQLEDLGSSGGTYVDGHRIGQSVTMSGTTEVRLGDAESGERVLVVAPGATRPAPPAGAAGSSRRRSKAPLIVAAVVVVVAVVVGGIALFASGGGSPDLDQLARATVRLQVQTEEDGVIGGSGTIIDAEQGLILTNAHVVAPDAPGLAVQYQDPVFDFGPAEQIRIDVATGLDEAAEPSFLGEVVAVDGYLDVAVVQLTRRLSGALLEDGDLDGLEDVDLGDSDDISTGESLRILGYPSVSDSNAPNLTSGVVSSFVQDDRLETNRAFLNVAAEIAAGNSGGLAVDDDGRIVGIPTLTRFSGPDEANRIRPISFAMPVIDAALADEDYESPYTTELAEDATATVVSSVAPAGSPGFRTECSSLDAGLQQGTDTIGLAIDYAGFGDGPHQDVLVEVVRLAADGDEIVGSTASGEEHPVAFGPSGCAEVTVGLVEPLVSGDYEILVWAGPNYDLLEIVEVTIG